jgi:hypothetical protein
VSLQGLERPFPYESVRDELLVEAPLARGTRAKSDVLELVH